VWVFFGLAVSAAVFRGLSFKKSREEERAWAELAACHREGTDSFHLKMMELVFTGARTLFAAAVATIQQHVSLSSPLCWLGNQTS